MNDIQTLLRQAALELAAAGSPTPRLDAEVLLLQVLNADRLALFLHPGLCPDEAQGAAFARAIERRRRGEPVAYIQGEKEFWSLPFEVNPAVLIPRPDTECLLEEALKRCGTAAGAVRIIDIGTGSGAIAVVLARERPAARIVATDISRAALAVAQRNAARHGVAGRIEFLPGDLFAGAAGSFDAIVSNPPYIPEGVYLRLAPGVRDFEPREALVAGADGMACHRRIAAEGIGRLRPGGWLLLEIGAEQGEAVASLLRGAGYEQTEIRQDYGGLDRVALGRKG
jgi:release factor glutamine methyltransferase